MSSQSEPGGVLGLLCRRNKRGLINAVAFGVMEGPDKPGRPRKK